MRAAEMLYLHGAPVSFLEYFLAHYYLCTDVHRVLDAVFGEISSPPGAYATLVLHGKLKFSARMEWEIAPTDESVWLYFVQNLLFV